MDCHYALVIYVCLPTGLSDIHRGEYLSLASRYQLEEGQLVFTGVNICPWRAVTSWRRASWYARDALPATRWTVGKARCRWSSFIEAIWDTYKQYIYKYISHQKTVVKQAGTVAWERW